MSCSRRRSHVHVERMRPIKVHIWSRGRDVGVPQRQRLAGNKPKRRLGVLAEAVQIGSIAGQRRRDLQIAIFEDEAVGIRGEENLAGGAVGDGEVEGRDSAEGEDEVGTGGGENMAIGCCSAGFVGKCLTWDDFRWDFPSRLVGVGDADSEAALRFKA